MFEFISFYFHFIQLRINSVSIQNREAKHLVEIAQELGVSFPDTSPEPSESDRSESIVPSDLEEIILDEVILWKQKKNWEFHKTEETIPACS